MSWPRLVRNTLKMGRRYRTPPVLPALEVNGQTLMEASTIQKAFETHFAIPENGEACSVQWLLARAVHEPVPTSIIDCAELPDVTDIACGFLALRCCRAPGASMIPAEAYRGAATAAHFPIT